MSALAARHGVWITAVVALVVRLVIVFSVSPGYPGDMAGWVDTTQRITAAGPQAGYAVLAPGSLYPPAFMYPLWAAGQVYEWCCSTHFEHGTRALDEVMLLGPILADTLLAVLVYALARRWLSAGRATVAGLLYALSPAALTTVAWQGMIGDPYYGVLIMVAVLSALSGRPALAACSLTLSVLTKPQGLAFGPLVGLLVLRRASLRQVAAAVAVSGLTTAAVLLPFALGGTLDSVWSAVQGMGSIHAYTQNSADNLWLLLQVGDASAKVSYLDGAVPDGGLFFGGLSYQATGLLLFGALYAATLARLIWTGRPRDVTLGGAIVGLGFFFLNTRMHVNYVFMAFPFLCALAAAGSRRMWLALAAASLACLVDWDALGKWPWPDGLPIHQASAALYGLGFVLLCSAACMPARLRVPLASVRRRRLRPAKDRLAQEPRRVVRPSTS